MATLGDYLAPLDGGQWYGCNKTITYSASTTGATSTKTIFTVTGLVRLRIYAKCITTLTSGGSATIEVGTTTNTAGLIAQTTATNIATNEIWQDATPDASVELDTTRVTNLVSESVTEKIATATVTGGSIQYSVLWQPVSQDGMVVAA